MSIPGSALVPSAGAGVPLARTFATACASLAHCRDKKFVAAGRRNQRSGRARYPEFLAALLLMASSLSAGEAQVSFHREIAPIFRRSCNGCHRPSKAKGGLDLTTFASVMKGGKAGAILEPGKAHGSELFEQIRGDEPEMPKDSEPLLAEEIAAIERWIAQGAKDDTPEGGVTHKLDAPPVYHSLPAVSALAWAPDGSVLAVAGFHEVLLRSPDGAEVLGRLVGESPRIESLVFSADGKLLAVAGGAPSEYGEIQIWNVAERKLMRSIKTTNDTVYGIAFSPDATRVAIGGSDKTVRVFAVADGREIMKCDNHIDWVFATAFTHDGARLVSGSRDRAVKLIDVATGRLIDDVSKPRDPIVSLARHPREDLVVSGDEKGALRLHKMIPRAGRLKEGDDKEESFVRELERLKGASQAVAFSKDGELIAAGSADGEARVYKTSDGKKQVTLKHDGGPVFAVAFTPDAGQVATAGLDGKVRLFDVKTGELVRSFDPVPLAAR